MVKKIQTRKNQIIFSNKLSYTLITLGILLIIVVGIYAVDKTKAWHSVSEIDFSEEGISGDLVVDGKIGIGTEPIAPLQIDTYNANIWGAWHEKIRLSDPSHAAITYYDSNENQGWLMGFHGVNDMLYFGWIDDWSGKTGSYKMTIKNNGNVGIGTTNPSAKLDVSGKIKAEDIVVNSNEYGDCSWTGWFSEEDEPMPCPYGTYVAGMECKGSYCNNIRLYCCGL